MVPRLSSCIAAGVSRDPKKLNRSSQTAFHLPLWTAHLPVVASVAACSACSEVLARVPPVKGRVSSPVLAIAVAAVAANVGVLPAAHVAYDCVADQLLPVATSLFLFEANMRRLRTIGRTGLAFLVGALGTCLGGILAFVLLRTLPFSPALAGLFTATYIGGTVNYLGVARALNLSSAAPSLLAAGLAVDNVLMAMYISVLFVLGPAEEGATEEGKRSSDHAAGSARFKPVLVPAAVATAITLRIVADFLSGALHLPAVVSGIPVMSVLTAAAATVLPRPFREMGAASAPVAATIFSAFFVSIGASAQLSKIINVGGAIAVFAATVLAVHGLVLYFVGAKLLKLPVRDLLVASNANIGGAGTAAAFASERNWKDLVLSAVLLGCMGYIVATPVGVGLVELLRRFQP